MPDLRALLDAATPGPWRWHGQLGPHNRIRLATAGQGVLSVMEPQRLGMQSAEFVFWRREADTPWGWNGKREPVSEVAVREVPYRDDIVDIDNPNAQLIVAAVNALPGLLDVVGAVTEYLAHDGSGIRQTGRFRGDWDAIEASAALARLRAALDNLEADR